MNRSTFCACIARTMVRVPSATWVPASPSDNCPVTSASWGVGEVELGRGADQDGDLVAAVQELLDDKAADAAGRAEDGDTQGSS